MAQSQRGKCEHREEPPTAAEYPAGVIRVQENSIESSFTELCAAVAPPTVLPFVQLFGNAISIEAASADDGSFEAVGEQLIRITRPRVRIVTKNSQVYSRRIWQPVCRGPVPEDVLLPVGTPDRDTEQFVDSGIYEFDGGFAEIIEARTGIKVFLRSLYDRCETKQGFGGQTVEWPLPTLSDEELLSAKAGGPAWLDFLATTSNGLVRYNASVPDFDLELIAAAARAHPSERIVVLAGTGKRAKQAMWFFERWLPSHQFALRLGDTGLTGPCNVITLPSRLEGAMEYENAGDESRSVRFVFHLVSGRMMQESRLRFLMSHHSKARVIGLLREQEPLPPDSRARLQGWYGGGTLFLEQTSTSGSSTTYRRPAYVAMLPYEHDAKQVQTSLKRLRQKIWKNHDRNRMGTELARQIAAGHVKEVAKLCPQWASGLPPESELRVAVVVSGVDQAVAVCKLLGDWPLRMLPFTSWNLPPQFGKVLDKALATEEAPRKGVIMTLAHFCEATQQSEPERFDVVMRLDAGNGSIPAEWATAPGSSVFSEFNYRPRLLVDMLDFGDPKLLRRAAGRAQYYVESADYQLRGPLFDAAREWDVVDRSQVSVAKKIARCLSPAVILNN